MRILIFCFLLISPILAYSEDEAKKLNQLGYEAYKNGQYEIAADYFYQAIQADDSYIYAHHNYACVLVKKDGQSNINETIKHLKREIELNPKRIEKILSDTDLDLIRFMKEFTDFILDGNDFSRIGFSPAPGSCAPGNEIRFYPDGNVAYHEVWEGRDGDYTISQPTFSGRYAIIQSQIIVYFPGISNLNDSQESDLRLNDNNYNTESDYFWGTYINDEMKFDGLHFTYQENNTFMDSMVFGEGK